jgi:hypothetical protein
VIADKIAGEGNDGYLGSRAPQRDQCRAADEDNHIHSKPHKFSRELIQPINPTLAEPILDENVLTLDIAKIS